MHTSRTHVAPAVIIAVPAAGVRVDGGRRFVLGVEGGSQEASRLQAAQP